MKNNKQFIDKTQNVSLYRLTSMDDFRRYANEYIPKHLKLGCYMDFECYNNLVRAMFNDPIIIKSLKERYRDFQVTTVKNIFVKDFIDFGFAGPRIVGPNVFYIMGRCHGKNGFNLMFIIYHDGFNFQLFTIDETTRDIYTSRTSDREYMLIKNELIDEFNKKAIQAIKDMFAVQSQTSSHMMF